ncbi:hypothetical protein CRG98_019457 [Punica granatum]|uniref:Uncharacterized protein n=1 Tax=Punica granatum TaxID=22663 RepID=A0A2I0JW81_PUNGR|nr:hypothetical protein CRG98_019457 [Punica granatum]
MASVILVGLDLRVLLAVALILVLAPGRTRGRGFNPQAMRDLAVSWGSSWLGPSYLDPRGNCRRGGRDVSHLHPDPIRVDVWGVRGGSSLATST